MGHFAKSDQFQSDLMDEMTFWNELAFNILTPFIMKKNIFQWLT